MKKQQIVAAVILVLVVAWMAIPRNSQSAAEVPEGSDRQVSAIAEDAAPSDNPDIITVRARQINQEVYVQRVRVRGRTQAFRHVQVRAEQAGRIVSNPVARGARVEAGDLLCEIAIDGRDVALVEAQDRLEQARLEYQAALDLERRNLQSQVQVAQLKSAVSAAETAAVRASLALEKTRIVAPFAGVVEQRSVEIGDLLNIGDVCASVLDDDPMLLVGLVPEQDVGRLSVGAGVNAELLGGQQLTGKVTFLAGDADPISRSYRIEATVDPGSAEVRAGVTAEIMVRAAEVNAHRIPSSALSLDDSGEIGVKLIGRNGEVSFHNVEIVGDDTDEMNPSVWVTGLSGDVTLITVGQEIVFPGQTVEANLDWQARR